MNDDLLIKFQNIVNEIIEPAFIIYKGKFVLSNERYKEKNFESKTIRAILKIKGYFVEERNIDEDAKLCIVKDEEIECLKASSEKLKLTTQQLHTVMNL